MSLTNNITSPQSIAEIVSVAAEGRLNDDPSSKAQAFVDVTLYFRPGGSLTIHGCTVLHETGKGRAVLFPSRRGEHRYFPVITNTGEIRRMLEEAVLKEYERLRGAAE